MIGSGYSTMVDNSDEALFLNYQKELDMRHDRHEQIVKCSRDITSESKKIIFLLHRYSGKKTDEEKREILEEAKERLNEVRSSLLLKVAKAMSCVMDQYMHNSAITFGIQEHIEASAFFKFISTGQLLMYDEMKELFTFAENDPDGDLKEYSLEITPLDYLLGLSDVGGELMRYATNQYSAGDISTAENVVDFMRVIYRGYLLHHSQHRDFTQKTVIFRQSLMKVENLLYVKKLKELEKKDLQCSVNAY